MIPTQVTVTSNPPPTVVRGAGRQSIHRAREATRAFTDLLCPAPDPNVADTLVLVVSELVTNAVRHGGGKYTLELSADPGVLTVAVTDPTPAHPRERTPDLNGSAGGFGWHMVRDRHIHGGRPALDRVHQTHRHVLGGVDQAAGLPNAWESERHVAGRAGYLAAGPLGAHGPGLEG
ncbi:ATP-binding protein [Streptomyces sp. NPDC057307]|uniref:ATP-binding protein n=1 Tax=Streptomyces sp. NPDC057307 TaxID=3346096 RepID=UPI00363ECFC1